MSSVRKIGIVVGITGLVLAMASGTGFAVTASISFDECTVSTKPCPSYTDGQPTVTTAGLTGTGGIGSPTISYQVGGEGAPSTCARGEDRLGTGRWFREFMGSGRFRLDLTVLIAARDRV